MATVPYDPIPKATPEVAPTRPLSINTNGAMFGENIGGALDTLGHDVTSVGSQLYATATNFLKMDSDAKVNDKYSEFIKEKGEVINKFDQLEGQDSQNNLKAHTDHIDNLYKSYVDSLGSDYEKKQFNGMARRQQSYDVLNAASRAATESKKYAKIARNAADDATIDEMLKDYKNPDSIREGIRKLTDSGISESMEAGETDVARRSTIDRKLALAAEKMSKSIKDPEDRIAFVNNFNGIIHTADFNKILSEAEDKAVTTRAARDAARIANPLQAIIDRARPVTIRQESGGDYTHDTPSTDPKTGKIRHALGAYGVMEENLPEWTQKAIGRVVSRDEFLANKDIQDKVYDTIMGGYIQKYGVEGAGRAWFGGETGMKNLQGKDRFGTTVDKYGKDFVSSVGQYDPKDSSARSFIDMDRAIVDQAEKYYSKDPERKQAYIKEGQYNIRQNTRTQQQEADQRETQLKGDVSAVLRTQDKKSGFAPRTIDEAMKLDPNFETKMDEIKKYDKTYKDKIDKTFAANATAETPWTIEKQNRYYEIEGMKPLQLNKVNEDDEYRAGLIMRDHLMKIKDKKAKVHLQDDAELHVDAMLQRNKSLLDKIKAYPSRSEDTVSTDEESSSEDLTANQRYSALRGRAIVAMKAYMAEKGVPMDGDAQAKMMKDLTKIIVTGTHDTFLGGIPRPGWAVTQDKEYEFQRQDRAAREEEAAAPKKVKPVAVRKDAAGNSYWMGDDNKVRPGLPPSE